MVGAFFNWCEQKVAICMSGATTPGWLPINEDNIITKVCEGVRMPNAESVLKTMQEHHSSFPSCQPQHFRRRGNCCYLRGTWETIEFIQHFLDCQASVRSRREAKDINVSGSYSHTKFDIHPRERRQMLNKCQLILATGGTVAQDLTMQWSTMGGFFFYPPLCFLSTRRPSELCGHSDLLHAQGSA